MRASIEVSLGPDEALALVEQSFVRDRGWALDRRDHGLLISAGPERRVLVDPDPGPLAVALPETLALRVDAQALGPTATRVEARVVRLVGQAIAAVLGDLLWSYGLGSLLHAQQMFEFRRERRGAKRRMLRLAIEPLQPHQRAQDLGPFRRGRGG